MNKIRRPAPMVRAGDPTGEDGEQYRWRGASGWEVLTRWPSVDEDDEEEVAFIVSGLPCAGEVLVFGMALNAPRGDSELVMSARALRTADDAQESLVFVGEDARVEVGLLAEQDEMSARDELSAILDGLTEAEAGAALNAIAAYRRRHAREPGQVIGAYDGFIASLAPGQVFSAQDVFRAGASLSRAYHRIKADLEDGRIVVVDPGTSGAKGRPATYKIK